MIASKMRILMVAAALALATPPARCQDASAQAPDPYEIFNRSYTAMGGLDKIKAQKTMHVEGDLVLVGTGLQGKFSDWTERPIRERQEVDLKVIKQVSGDNGENAWTVDQNGKVEIRDDEKTLKERKLRILMAEFDFLDPQSEVFNVVSGRVDTAFGKPCYVVSIHNTLNKDVTSNFYDTTSYMLLKSVAKSPEGTTTTWYSDYRDVGGVPFAYHQGSLEEPSGMKTETTFTTAEANVPIDPQMFEPPKQDVTDFHFTNGKSAENIPFQFIENHIYLPVTVAGKERLWVLDTGAGLTVIGTAFARELGLSLEGQVKAQGTGHQVEVSFTTLPDLSIPGLEFNSQTVAAIELRTLFHNWVGLQVDGILGYDFLSRLVTKVDYAHEQLSFYLPDSFNYTGDGVVLSTPVSQQNMLELPVAVDGTQDGMWSLDLGAGGMSYHYQYAGDHGLLDRPGVDALGRGAGGYQAERRVLSDSMALAGFTVKDIEITVPQERGEGAFGYTELIGNLGNTLLRHFTLYLDYKREQVIVERGADFDRDFPRDNSGLQIVLEGADSIKVIFVAPNTPASEAGFQVDDVITAIDGSAPEALNGIVGIKDLLRGKPGTKLAVDIARGAETKNLSLTLRDLFE